MSMNDEVWEAPGDDSSLREKLAFQKRLRDHLEEPWSGPHNMPWIKGETMDSPYRWWTRPYDPAPRSPKKKRKSLPRQTTEGDAG
jgi:hypothetical protein